MPATFSPRPIFAGGESQLNMKYPATDTGTQFNMQAPTPVVNQGGPGNPGGANNMPKVPPNFWKGPAYDNSGINPQLGRQMAPRGPMPQFDPALMERLRMGGSRGGQGGQPPQDPFNQYGNAGQSPSLGRYVPPMMNNPNGNNQDWTGGGGYSYNIPNSYGSSQWNQFNSTDRANPAFGQLNPGISGGGTGRGYNVPMPQFQQSPFARPDPQRAQQYQQFMMSLAQGQQPQGQAPQAQSGGPSMTVMPQIQSNPY